MEASVVITQGLLYGGYLYVGGPLYGGQTFIYRIFGADFREAIDGVSTDEHFKH